MPLCDARAERYRLLAHVFQNEPTVSELRALVNWANGCGGRGGGVGEGERGGGCGQAPAPEHEDRLRGRLRGFAGHDLQALQADIRTAYAELFVGPRPPLAPLYESLYRGFPRRLFTDVTRSVRETYRRQGMEVAAKNRIPDDHLGFELGFMACLCDKAQDAASAGSGQKEERLLRSAQQEFLHEHLARWTGDFANKVRAADTCGYYAAWADFAASHVEEDCRLDPL